jgi:hypothetical protein
MTTADCLQKYRDSVLEAESFISEAHNKDASGNYIHPVRYRNFVISSAVVKFSIAWESFLEHIYCAFLLGEQDTQGRIVPCCVSVSSLEHAHKLLIGTNKYFDWTNPDLVVQLSSLFLNPDNPIKTAINSTKSDLLDLKTIRNAAAHISSSTQQKLDSVASRLYGHQAINSKVEEVITFMRPDGKTQWAYFKDLLDVAAENVAKGIV